MDGALGGLQNLSVMVVDYDRWTRLHLTSALDELGVSVAEASNGMTALRHALAHAPNVMIVGSRLPELGAPELMDGLRSHPHTRQTAIIGLSHAVAGDADLQLPCTPADVLASVAGALAAHRRNQSARTAGRDTSAPKRARSNSSWRVSPQRSHRGARLSKR